MAHGDGKNGGFGVDVDMLRKQLRNRLEPALRNFQENARRLDSLESHSMSSVTSGEGRGGVSAGFVTAFDTKIAELVSERDKAVRTLASFVGGLKAAASYYQGNENENIRALRALHRDI